MEARTILQSAVRSEQSPPELEPLLRAANPIATDTAPVALNGSMRQRNSGDGAPALARGRRADWLSPHSRIDVTSFET
jgi:hypothetical protein